MYTDINEVDPVTIVSSRIKNGRDIVYYALNIKPHEVCDPDELACFLTNTGDREYVRRLDFWIETNNKCKIGRGESIKEACQDLVKKLNENEVRSAE